ncbi:MAG: hypothetical protein GY861_14360 [bacterium]|nr:hypothetical protein [bacterium]
MAFPELSTGPANVVEDILSSVLSLTSSANYLMIRPTTTKIVKEWKVTYDEEFHLNKADRDLLKAHFEGVMGLFFDWINPDEDTNSSGNLTSATGWTFTKDSVTVTCPTGEGNANNEISDGYYIRPNGGVKWYKVVDRNVSGDSITITPAFQQTTASAVVCNYEEKIYGVYYDMKKLTITPIFTNSTYYTTTLTLKGALL